MLASSLILIGESPVAADQYTDDLCLYQDRDFNHVWPFSSNIQCFGGGERGNVSSAMNDRASSLDNRGFGSQRMCLYEHANQQGRWLLMEPGSYHKNLAWDALPGGGGTWNDRISSVGPYPCGQSLTANSSIAGRADDPDVVIQVPTC